MAAGESPGSNSAEGSGARDALDEVPGAQSSASEAAGQAAFSPFGTLGLVVHPAAAVQEPAGGDWSAPMTAAVVGAVFVAKLIRMLTH